MSELLKIHVERAVRPVRADMRRKLRMREELYATLLDLRDEEQRRLKSDDAAAAAAIARFGVAESLTAELQATVPKLEQWASWIDRVLRQRPGESVWRHAGRIGAMYLGFMAAVLAVTWSVALPIRGWAAIGESGVLTITLLPVMALGAVVFVLLGKALSYGLAHLREKKRAWLAVTAAPLGVMGYVLAAGYGTVLAASREPAAATNFLSTMSPAAAAALVLHCGVVALIDWERRLVAQWEDLDLSVQS